MHQGTALDERKDHLVDAPGVFRTAQDEPPARTAQRLVRCRGDDIRVRDRTRVMATRDQPRDVGEVDDVHGAHLGRDPGERREVEGTGIRRCAAHDQLGPAAPGHVAHLVVVDSPVFLAHPVGVHAEEAPAEVDRGAVGEVAAVAEVHPQDVVARLQEGEVGGHVGLGPGVGLDVRVIRAEEAGRAVAGQLLDLVGELAPAVVAPSGQSLRVLVGENGPQRFPDRGRHEVLARDHLQLPQLPGGLVANRAGDLWIGPFKVFQRLPPGASGTGRSPASGSRWSPRRSRYPWRRASASRPDTRA